MRILVSVCAVLAVAAGTLSGLMWRNLNAERQISADLRSELVAARAELAARRPDIICLQEVRPDHLAGPEIRAWRDEVISKIGTIGLVDVRSPEEFRGEKLAPDHLPQEQSQVPGHVPGAANIPWVLAANDDGTFKSADELRELYEGQGITADREVIAYCRIGERSSHTWFALQELLGYANVKNYDGSWTEYGSLVGAPVEVG